MITCCNFWKLVFSVCLFVFCLFFWFFFTVQSILQAGTQSIYELVSLKVLLLVQYYNTRTYFNTGKQLGSIQMRIYYWPLNYKLLVAYQSQKTEKHSNKQYISTSLVFYKKIISSIFNAAFCQLYPLLTCSMYS